MADELKDWKRLSPFKVWILYPTLVLYELRLQIEEKLSFYNSNKIIGVISLEKLSNVFFKLAIIKIYEVLKMQTSCK